MKLQEFISKLNKIYNDKGNIEVFVRDENGIYLSDVLIHKNLVDEILIEGDLCK